MTEPPTALPKKSAIMLEMLNVPFKNFYLFLKRGEGREKERERNINVRLPVARPPQRAWPATQACAPTRNQTSDPLVHRPALSPLSHTSQA